MTNIRGRRSKGLEASRRAMKPETEDENIDAMAVRENLEGLIRGDDCPEALKVALRDSARGGPTHG